MSELTFARDGKGDTVLPLASPRPGPHAPGDLLDRLRAAFVDAQIPPHAAAYFVDRVAVFLSSCDARRAGEWESTGWADFVGADRFGDDYRALVGASSQLLQAAKAHDTSAYFVGWFLELTIYSVFGRGSNGPAWRVLNSPTSDAWIDPWVSALTNLGASLLIDHELVGLDVRHGRIAGARVQTPATVTTISADWYACALPVERPRGLWNAAILEIDPTLARMNELATGLMVGIQFYLRQRRDAAKGHVACTDSPWAIAFIEQAQFWDVDFASTFGDGNAHDCLSAIISNWTEPGVVFGKAASDCRADEIARETWEQIKAHVNKPGAPADLDDAAVLAWALDAGMVPGDGGLISEDPLVLARTGTAQHRPTVETAIPNLLLAGDYLAGDWQVATMESACYSGRRAANAILERSGARGLAATVVGPYRPREWEALKRIDEYRYANRQANLFDADRVFSPDVERLFGRQLVGRWTNAALPGSSGVPGTVSAEVARYPRRLESRVTSALATLADHRRASGPEDQRAGAWQAPGPTGIGTAAARTRGSTRAVGPRNLQGVDFGCPWPPRVSPFLEYARDHALAWMQDFGLAADPNANERLYRDWKLGELAAYFYPDATPEGLALGADLMGWYFAPFDDQFDGELGRDPRLAAEICGDLIAILDVPDDAPLPVSYPVAAAFADIWRRSLRGMSLSWRERAAQHWKQYLAGQVAEVVNRRHNRNPDAVSQLRQRVSTTSTLATVDLVEPASGYEVPDLAWQTPVLYELRQLTAELISLSNDLVSADKEEAQGDGANNLLLILESQEGRSRAEAVDQLRRMTHERHARFLRLEQQVPDLDDILTAEARIAVRRHVSGLHDVIAADNEWAHTSGRYAPALLSRRPNA